MALERPKPGAATPIQRLGHALDGLKARRRRLAFATMGGIGAALCTYGLLSLMLAPAPVPVDGDRRPSIPAGPKPTEEPAAADGAGPVKPIGDDQRLVAIADDGALPVGAGDRVELVAIVSGPLEPEAHPLHLATVVDVQPGAIIVTLDRDEAIEVVEAQARGSVAVLGAGHPGRVDDADGGDG